MLELLRILNINSTNMVKLARETREILLFRAAILSFWKS